MIVERDLVHRIEHTAALDAAALVAPIAVIAPDLRPTAIPLAGGQGVLLGAGMFVNRAIGLALGGAVTDDDFDTLEAAAADVGVPAEVEVCPWADQSLIERISARDYRTAWFRTALARTLSPDDTPIVEPNGGEREPAASVDDDTADGAPRDRAGIVIESVDDDSLAIWQDIASAGFGYVDESQRRVSDVFARAIHRNDGETLFIAAIDGEHVGAASLTVRDGMATIGGMTTLPGARRRGVQGALIRHRLAVAAGAGCDLAVTTASPSSISERNLMRHGFQVLYTQTCVRKVGDA